MYEVLLDYAFNKTEPNFNTGTYNPITKFFWIGVKPVMEKNWAQYENGCKGGAPVGNTNNKGKKKVNPKLTQSQTYKDKEEDIDKEEEDEEKDEDIVGDGENAFRPPAFNPPTLEDVLNYYNYKHGYLGTSDESVAIHFYNHYSANGWMMGQTPMRNWKAALESWILKEKKFQARPGQPIDPREKLSQDAVKAMAALATESRKPKELPF